VKKNDDGKTETLVGVIHSYDSLTELYTIKFATDKGLSWKTMKEEDVKEHQCYCWEKKEDDLIAAEPSW